MDYVEKTGRLVKPKKTKERILRVENVLAIIGMKRSWLWGEIRAGNFPRPIRLGKRAIGWKESEIMEWICNRPKATLTMVEVELRDEC
jgi:prophage regulatory protein